MNKYYVFAVRRGYDPHPSGYGYMGRQYVAVDPDTGKVIDSHYCTDDHWAKHDFPEHPNLKDMEMVFVDIETDAGLELIKQLDSMNN